MITTSIDQLNRLLARLEGCNLEFKGASGQFDRRHDLPDYCAALANERGGKLLLGVNDKGVVVGSKAFHGTYNKLSNELLSELGIRIDVEEVQHPQGRVLIFHVPSRPAGTVIRSTGHYSIPMRAGESLREMDDVTLRSILNESTPDFSMTIVPGLSEGDLEQKAMGIYKEKWALKSKRDDYRTFQDEKMLRSAGLLTDKGLNYASLVLFGKKEKLDEFLPDAEIIFEWRQSSASIPYDYRMSWRESFFAIYDSIWETINARNSRMPFQQGFIQREIYAFDEKSIREAVLNAVAHRDYTFKGQSIFIKASSDSFVITSPGGLPPGITPENILYKSYWRNRRIAETFEKAGLVERSGQGMDDIYQASIRDGKGLPDLTRSDAYSVELSIPARLKDKDFVLFLEKITNEKQIVFSFEEIFALEEIREKQRIDKTDSRDKFLQLGIIERVGRGRGTHYILSHRYYSHRGKTGVHTRLRGVPREAQKQLLIEHLKRNETGTSNDFRDIFPELSRSVIDSLLKDLKKAGIIVCIGKTRGGYWQLR